MVKDDAPITGQIIDLREADCGRNPEHPGGYSRGPQGGHRPLARSSQSKKGDRYDFSMSSSLDTEALSTQVVQTQRALSSQRHWPGTPCLGATRRADYCQPYLHIVRDQEEHRTN